MRKLSVALAILFMWGATAAADPVKILALGDSLTAGYGLEPQFAFPTRLEAALKAKGRDVVVVNAGVSGDTAAQGAARLDWALTDDIQAVIVELGANDALRGLPPGQAKAALDELLSKLKAKDLPVLLAGMKSPPNMGEDYVKAFDAMYPELSAKHGAILYPFFLDGVVAVPELNQADGIHPNPQGVDIIVERILPLAEELLEKVK
jgi:acyl-CoA thioesterase I